MNNSFVQRQAKKLAELLQAKRPAGERVDYAYQLCFARGSTAVEKQEADSLIQQHGMEAFCWALLNSSEFLYLD
jgi:hypothetical protein